MPPSCRSYTPSTQVNNTSFKRSAAFPLFKPARLSIRSKGIRRRGANASTYRMQNPAPEGSCAPCATHSTAVSTMVGSVMHVRSWVLCTHVPTHSRVMNTGILGEFVTARRRQITIAAPTYHSRCKLGKLALNRLSSSDMKAGLQRSA